ncbi:MAG: Fic family protein [Planctomycetes bacterium]|nr:Fic family protein [Planctomycetota bacterium]
MKWNWQQPDWPTFEWSEARLAKAERLFLVNGGVFWGKLNTLSGPNQDLVSVETILSEAITTSQIEGEHLDRESLRSSIRRQLGLGFDQRRVGPAEQGIAEMMTALYREWNEPLSHQSLFDWHSKICLGRRDLKEVGSYRTHADSMQIVSGQLGSPKVHFEAPPSACLTHEMERFVEWFEGTSPNGVTPLPALARAGIAHLYFVSIHPFEDGNGRVGRAIAEKALIQSLGRPCVIGLATNMCHNQKDYYAALSACNQSNQITDWLAWMGGIVLEAQYRTHAQVQFLLEKTRLFDRLADQLNERQATALMRMFREGVDGFCGGLSAGNYVSITKASTATATRDLADLVAKGALRRSGERKHTRYSLAIAAFEIPKVRIHADGHLIEAVEFPNE